MGDIADDYIEGRCCTKCMTYFKRAHGFPVLCHYCYDGAEQMNLPRAFEPELNED